MQKTDYSKIAPTYNQRYVESYLPSIEKEIISIVQENDYKTILEAGCGTGRWLKSLNQLKYKIIGLDYSVEMLKVSREENPSLKLINADADFIPLKNDYFDLIFCVNSIHHFPDKEIFVKESRRVLSENGTLAIFGVDPHVDRDWYVYDYFDNVYENDLKRFPSLEQLKKLLDENYFKNVEIKSVEEIFRERVGEDVLNDPFLQKNHSSQLANLSDEEYEQGLEKIKMQIKKHPNTIFRTSIIFYLISAKKN